MKNNKLPGSHWYTYAFVYGVIKPFLIIYLFFQNVHYRRNGFKVPREPVFFIGNHHSNWDGFYHCVMFYGRIPHFIVHDELFKSKGFARFFGNFLGQLPRARIPGAMTPIITIKRLLSAGQSVNVYPEGDISMFGTTIPIDISIAKMARMLDVPVIITRVKGAHLRAPRWSRLPHHSRITYEISDVIFQEELKIMTIEELHSRIKKGIYVCAYDDREKEKVKVWGGHRAEWIELGLFYCPSCHRYETIVSRGNDFVCLHCGMLGHVNRQLMIETYPNQYFTRPDKWDDYQQQELKSMLDKAVAEELLFSLGQGQCEIVPIDTFFKMKGRKVTAKLFKDRIDIAGENDFRVTINIIDIVESQVQYKDVFEIITKYRRIRLWRKTPKWSAYLWANCVKILKEI